MKALKIGGFSPYLVYSVKNKLESNLFLGKFLLSLEKLERITKISKMNISSERNAEGIATVSFVLSIFFQRDST